MKRRLWTAAVAYGAACLKATEVTVVVSTDVPCARVQSVQVFVGETSAELETLAPAAQTQVCDAKGNIGSVVIVPPSSGDSRVIFSVVAGVDTPTDQCRKNGYRGCVVARRALRFVDHTPLQLPVKLAARCLGESCAAVGGQLGTCQDGFCVPAAISDPQGCTTPGNCSPAPSPVGLSGTLVASSVGPYGVGFGYQHHSFYSQGSPNHWIFYFDPKMPSQIESRISSDLSNWTEGPIVQLPGALGDGNNFDVAYAHIGDADVVHIVADVALPNIFETVHVRTTIDSNSLTQPSIVQFPNTTNANACPDDGPSTLVTADGHVLDVTAWTLRQGTSCDSNIYRSATADDGVSFAADFALAGYYISVPGYTHSHDLIELSPNRVLGAWPDQDIQQGQDQALYRSVGWDLSDTFAASEDGGVKQAPSAEVFFAQDGGVATSGDNDWSLCRLSSTDVWAIRHVTKADGGTGDFEAMRFDGASWHPAPAPHLAASNLNAGLVLLSDTLDTDGLLAATLTSDNLVHVERWTPKSGWSRSFDASPVVNGVTTPVQHLSGTPCGTAHPLLFWTQNAKAPYDLYVADAYPMFAP